MLEADCSSLCIIMVHQANEDYRLDTFIQRTSVYSHLALYGSQRLCQSPYFPINFHLYTEQEFMTFIKRGSSVLDAFQDNNDNDVRYSNTGLQRRTHYRYYTSLLQSHVTKPATSPPPDKSHSPSAVTTRWSHQRYSSPQHHHHKHSLPPRVHS